MLQDDNFEKSVEYANMVHYFECLILRWIGKGSYFDVPLRIVDEAGTEHNLSVSVIALNEQHAFDRARQIGMLRRVSSSSNQDDLGFIFPKKKSLNSDEFKQGWIKRRISGAKDKAKSAYFHEGMPKPLSLTRGHIAAMLQNKSFENVPSDLLSQKYVATYINRCSLIALMWFCIDVFATAITFAGLHESHTRISIFGWFNPLFLFGVVAFIVGVLGFIHAIMARKNALIYLKKLDVQ